MFSVTVRFLMQASMSVILIIVAQDAVDTGSPENMSKQRIFFNFMIALILELYLFVSCQDHTTWSDLWRLYNVKAIEYYPLSSASHGEGTKIKANVGPGDYYVRMAMSVLITGIFHKFLVLLYPLLVFTTFARDDWVVLLKDVLAITIVVQLDNVLRPWPCTMLTDSHADEGAEEGEEEEKED